MYLTFDAMSIRKKLIGTYGIIKTVNSMGIVFLEMICNLKYLSRTEATEVLVFKIHANYLKHF